MKIKEITEKIKPSEDASGIDFDMQFDDDTGSFATVTARAHGRTLGSVEFFVDGDILVADQLEVDERYRGQGIAAAMYDYAKAQGYTIEKSPDLTPDGEHFWNKNQGDKTVWEEGWKGALAGGLAGGALGGLPGVLIGGAAGYALGGSGPNDHLPDSIQDAYKLGQEAAREGQTQDDNPYEEGWLDDEAMMAWHDGWEDATKEDQLTPEHGPYKGMELFPITKKPWTQEQIDWYNHKVRLMHQLGWSNRQMGKWFKKRYL